MQEGTPGFQLGRVFRAGRRVLASLGGFAHEVLRSAFFDFFVRVAADQAVDAADVEDNVTVVAAHPTL